MPLKEKKEGVTEKKEGKKGMIISMAYTTPSVVARAKGATRRYWKEDYAKRFKNNQVSQAYSKRPTLKGERIAFIRHKFAPFQEEMGVHDTVDKVMGLYIEEGFKYLDDPENDYPLVDVLTKWIGRNDLVWVVQFDIVSVEAGMYEKYCTKQFRAQCREALIKNIAGEDDEDQSAEMDETIEVGEKTKDELKRQKVKCQWCKEEVSEVFPKKIEGKIHNICSQCEELEDNGEYGKVAEYLGHIPKGEGQKVDDKYAPTGMKKVADGFFECPKCGAVVPETVDVCTSCKTSFRAVEKPAGLLADVPEEKEEEEQVFHSVSELEKMMKKRDEKQEKVKAICPNCRAEVEEDAEECPKCGAVFYDLEDGEVLCPNCEIIIKKGVDVCEGCGMTRKEIEAINEAESSADDVDEALEGLEREDE